VNMALNAVFLYGTPLAQVGIALATSISGWLNTLMLGAVLMRRGQLKPDARLTSRALRTAGATIGMGVVLVACLVFLQSPLSHPSLMGVAALAAICAIGGVAYGLLAMALGVLNLGELRAMLRRPTRSAAEDAPAEP
jgi:putative peptidoglycan lipid II flippase